MGNYEKRRVCYGSSTSIEKHTAELKALDSMFWYHLHKKIP